MLSIGTPRVLIAKLRLRIGARTIDKWAAWVGVIAEKMLAELSFAKMVSFLSEPSSVCFFSEAYQADNFQLLLSHVLIIFDVFCTADLSRHSSRDKQDDKGRQKHRQVKISISSYPTVVC